jgi:hypothetical protein
MRWNVETLNKTYKVEANSSKEAVEKVDLNDDEQIIKVSIAPAGVKGNIRKKWRDWFGK